MNRRGGQRSGRTCRAAASLPHLGSTSSNRNTTTSVEPGPRWLCPITPLPQGANRRRPRSWCRCCLRAEEGAQPIPAPGAPLGGGGPTLPQLPPLKPRPAGGWVPVVLSNGGQLSAPRPAPAALQPRSAVVNTRPPGGCSPHGLQDLHPSHLSERLHRTERLPKRPRGRRAGPAAEHQ